MVRVHETVGTLVLIAFLALIVVNALRLSGRSIPWARQLTFLASGLLLLQYVLGFGLLGGSSSITPWHYLIALSALIPVGAEHGLANQQSDPRLAGRYGLIANIATFVLVLIAYTIGMNNS